MSSRVSLRGASQKPTEESYKVMLVDDSAVIRGLLTRTLESDPNIEVVASASNGEQAISVMKRHTIEVVVLDIEMPIMDGLTALPRLFAIDRHVQVIMASTLTQKNAKVSFQALAAGAADYIPKPSATRDIHSGDGFKRELTEKVKALGAAYRLKAGKGQADGAASGHAARSASSPKAGMRYKTADAGASDARAIDLRRASPGRVDVIAIGSSTGGPEALLSLMTELNGSVDVPVMITQHMPPTFTTILAEHIGRASGKQCAEAVDGERVLPGRIFLAPGDYHMTVALEDGEKVIHLNQDPPVNFCRPAVDMMLTSLAQAYGRNVLAVILTGMGHDGLDGGRAVTEADGIVIAQDEATSVIWGMPGAVAQAGLCSAVLPLDNIAPYLRQNAGRRVK